jgi:hypothetical protein
MESVLSHHLGLWNPYVMLKLARVEAGLQTFQTNGFQASPRPCNIAGY